MAGRVENGTHVTVEPLRGRLPEKGDVVLARVNGRWVLHLVNAVAQQGRRVQIANTRGRVNGWTALSNVAGVLKE